MLLTSALKDLKRFALSPILNGNNSKGIRSTRC